MIFVGYYGVGESVCRESSTINLDNSYFSQVADLNWSDRYVDLAVDLSSHGFNVILSPQEQVQASLNKKRITYFTISPAVTLQDFWTTKLNEQFEASQLKRDYDTYVTCSKSYLDDVRRLQHHHHKIIIYEKVYNLGDIIAEGLERYESYKKSQEIIEHWQRTYNHRDSNDPAYREALQVMSDYNKREIYDSIVRDCGLYLQFSGDQNPVLLVGVIDLVDDYCAVCVQQDGTIEYVPINNAYTISGSDQSLSYPVKLQSEILADMTDVQNRAVEAWISHYNTNYGMTESEANDLRADYSNLESNLFYLWSNIPS